MNVIWREWYNESAIEAMTKMGTLPRNETQATCITKAPTLPLKLRASKT